MKKIKILIFPKSVQNLIQNLQKSSKMVKNCLFLHKILNFLSGGHQERRLFRVVSWFRVRDDGRPRCGARDIFAAGHAHHRRSGRRSPEPPGHRAERRAERALPPNNWCESESSA